MNQAVLAETILYDQAEKDKSSGLDWKYVRE